MTVTSRLHRQKDKERQRKTEEKGDRRPDDKQLFCAKKLGEKKIVVFLSSERYASSPVLLIRRSLIGFERRTDAN